MASFAVLVPRGWKSALIPALPAWCPIILRQTVLLRRWRRPLRVRHVHGVDGGAQRRCGRWVRMPHDDCNMRAIVARVARGRDKAGSNENIARQRTCDACIGHRRRQSAGVIPPHPAASRTPARSGVACLACQRRRSGTWQCADARHRGSIEECGRCMSRGLAWNMRFIGFTIARHEASAMSNPGAPEASRCRAARAGAGRSTRRRSCAAPGCLAFCVATREHGPSPPARRHEVRTWIQQMP
jgi:hypothetical protein